MNKRKWITICFPLNIQNVYTLKSADAVITQDKDGLEYAYMLTKMGDEYQKDHLTTNLD